MIVLFRLFPHKPGIEPVDREICEVLSNCAGRAIEPYQLPLANGKRKMQMNFKRENTSF